MLGKLFTLAVGVALGAYAMTIPGVKPAAMKLTHQTWTAIRKTKSAVTTQIKNYTKPYWA